VFDPVVTECVAIAVPNAPVILGATIYGAFVVADPNVPGNIGTISTPLPITIQ
jgi:hypothetical protein